MSKSKTGSMVKRIVDAVMSVLLLVLMAYQVTGEAAHEWIGMCMTVLVIIHQILNRKWYSALFKGRYNPYRTLSTVINVLLILSFALTAFSGMSMSGHAVPFLYGMAPISFARRTHLSMSHWSFVLMGLHLGMHIPAMMSGMKRQDKGRGKEQEKEQSNGQSNSQDKTSFIPACLFTVLGGIGLWLFLRNGIPDYLFFRVPFAFLDYDKAGWLVLLENLVMLSFWAFIGTQTANLLRNAARTAVPGKNPLLPVVFMMAAVIIGIVLRLAIPSGEDDMSFGGADWSAPQAESTLQAEGASQEESVRQEGSATQAETAALAGSTVQAEGASQADSAAQAETTVQAENVPQADTTAQAERAPMDDGFVLIPEGSFLMGSPDSENWRIDDETQHEVTVSSFYMDPHEATQADYARLMGGNPSTFSGDDLPVENITWLEALQYANAKSADSGLTPAYTISGNGVTWDRSADGYRLPTEAEWEYACRAGTTTPFNTEKSLSAAEANFYGHYPYEIEENYFNSGVLEAKPGEYRQTTIAVGSFSPNAWGLYDMHGNVNEWCWDYYGAYDASGSDNPTGQGNPTGQDNPIGQGNPTGQDNPAGQDNPTGPASGTRHVYRGGGWNDFAKNMRSAYRAAGQEDMRSFNLGVRLVRNADHSKSGLVTAGEKAPQTETDGKVLIAYFSWSGNTRGIAREIQSQTGADLFEISPVHPYSSDYSTVLMEAQDDQHRQARPELSGHVQNMDDYDIVLLGYPNWWASIPMPIATFLEEYDFSGKTIIPFCSHGGGRFGQSLTAIAKLAPDAVIGEGLSVHYSGGASLSSDVAAWLKENGISK